MSLFFDHTFDPVESFPYLCKGCVEWRKAETDVVWCAEVGDDVHFFDEGAVDAVAVCMADGDMRAAFCRVARGTEGKAQGGKPGFG